MAGPAPATWCGQRWRILFTEEKPRTKLILRQARPRFSIGENTLWGAPKPSRKTMWTGHGCRNLQHKRQEPVLAIVQGCIDRWDRSYMVPAVCLQQQ